MVVVMKVVVIVVAVVKVVVCGRCCVGVDEVERWFGHGDGLATVDIRKRRIFPISQFWT